MKQLYLIRHAKSSWSDPGLDDFDRPLNKRGKKDGPKMAERIADKGIRPDLIVSSPALRAKKTAAYMAKEVGYSKSEICYYDELYLGSLSYHLQLIDALFEKKSVVFLVGHNHTITELGEYLTGKYLGNVPTCGIVAVEYFQQAGFTTEPGAGRLVFFDFPNPDKREIRRDSF